MHSFVHSSPTAESETQRELSRETSGTLTTVVPHCTVHHDNVKPRACFVYNITPGTDKLAVCCIGECPIRDIVLYKAVLHLFISRINHGRKEAERDKLPKVLLHLMFDSENVGLYTTSTDRGLGFGSWRSKLSLNAYNSHRAGLALGEFPVYGYVRVRWVTYCRELVNLTLTLSVIVC